jgi:hypothetical protein
MAKDVFNQSSNFICDPSEFLSNLAEDSIKQLNDFIKSIQGTNLLNNPIVKAALNKIINSASTLRNLAIMEALDQEFGGLGSITDIVEDITGFVAAAMTFDTQMKLAMYALLANSLEGYITSRVSILSELSTLLSSVDRFLSTWDNINLRSIEREKLEKSTGYVKTALGYIKKASDAYSSEGKSPNRFYKKATANMDSATKALEQKAPITSTNEFTKYWKDWWAQREKQFIKFTENSLKIMNLLPADKAYLDKLVNKWDSIYILAATASIEEISSNNKTPFSQDWLSKTYEDLFNKNELISTNDNVRDYVKEIAELDFTWESLTDFAKASENFVEKWKNEIESLYNNMSKTLSENNDEVELAAKNSTYILETKGIYLGMSSTNSAVREYDNLTQDIQSVQTLVNICKNYPDKDKLSADLIPQAILSSYLSIFTGFTSPGGIRNSRILIGNIKRQISSAIAYDTKILNAINNFRILDNELIQAALRLYELASPQIKEALSAISKFSMSNAMDALRFSKIAAQLPGDVANLEFGNICGEEAVSGEIPEDLMTANLKFDVFQYQQLKQFKEMAGNSYYLDPYAYESDYDGVQYRGNIK